MVRSGAGSTATCPFRARRAVRIASGDSAPRRCGSVALCRFADGGVKPISAGSATSGRITCEIRGKTGTHGAIQHSRHPRSALVGSPPMGGLLGILASLAGAASFGSGDFAGGLASRRTGGLVVAAAAQLVGLAALADRARRTPAARTRTRRAAHRRGGRRSPVESAWRRSTRASRSARWGWWRHSRGWAR